MQYKFVANLSDDASTDIADSGDTYWQWLILGAAVLMILPMFKGIKLAVTPEKRTPRKYPRRKLTRGIRGAGKVIKLSRQSDGSYA